MFTDGLLLQYVCEITMLDRVGLRHFWVLCESKFGILLSHSFEFITQMEQCKNVSKNIFDTKYELQPVLAPHSLTVGPYAVVRINLSSLIPTVVIAKTERRCFLSVS